MEASFATISNAAPFLAKRSWPTGEVFGNANSHGPMPKRQRLASETPWNPEMKMTSASSWTSKRPWSSFDMAQEETKYDDIFNFGKTSDDCVIPPTTKRQRLDAAGRIRRPSSPTSVVPFRQERNSQHERTSLKSSDTMSLEDAPVISSQQMIGPCPPPPAKPTYPATVRIDQQLQGLMQTFLKQANYDHSTYERPYPTTMVLYQRGAPHSSSEDSAKRATDSTAQNTTATQSTVIPMEF